jgi:hypothetical protein
MQFLLMVYESAQWPVLPKEERRRIADDCERWHNELAARGVGRAGHGLAPPAQAAVVRKPSGSPVITDGPFIETKEVLGGFEIVECASRAEAIAIAETFPALADSFTMEVRAILTDAEFERMLNA